jgi:hypothetical protein
MNEKNQAAQERLYCEEKKSLRIIKEVAGWQKASEKLRQQKSSKQSQAYLVFPGDRGETEDTTRR